LRDYWMDTFIVTERAAPPPEQVFIQRNGDAPHNRQPEPVQPSDGIPVEHDGRKYSFTSKQIMAIINWVYTQKNYTVARDRYELGTGDYDDVCKIMVGLGHWQKQSRQYIWTRAGLSWLDDHLRYL
jgi:hypothetical protein